MRFFRLDEHHELLPATFEEAAVILADLPSRTVGADPLPDGRRILTVFLPIPQCSTGPGGAALDACFETTAIGGEEHEILERYKSWTEAEAGHRRWLGLLTAQARGLS